MFSTENLREINSLELGSYLNGDIHSSPDSSAQTPLLSSLETSPVLHQNTNPSTSIQVGDSVSGSSSTALSVSPVLSLNDMATPLFINTPYTEKRSAIVFDEDTSSQSSSKRIKSETDESPELPPIVVKNPHDPASVRRARNTEAARRSRAKKNNRLSQLEEMVDQLMNKNMMLEAENKVLKGMLGNK